MPPSLGVSLVKQAKLIGALYLENSLASPLFTTKPDGLGMGLSICRSIIQAHGGDLSASPRAPHGMALRFTIPIAAEM